MAKIIIIGAGAAGMAASVFLAEQGHQVHIYEKNEKPGKKLFITGKGRCNLTNSCDAETFFASVVTNPKFLYSAFYGCTNQDVLEFFQGLGLEVKEERGGRIFPASDHSSDVIRVLERRMKQLGVRLYLETEVKEVLTQETEDGVCIRGVCLADGTAAEADRVLVATGGYSYRATGSTGDGYRFARETGHRVTELLPALVPMETKEPYIPQMQGLSLKNVSLVIKDGKKELYHAFGEMLFTHFGISGPLVLTASSYVGKRLQKKELSAYIDLKPALSPQQLDTRLLREFEAGINKQFKNVVSGMFPAKMFPVILELGGIPPEKKVHEITKKERQDFIRLVKGFPMTITGLRNFREAIITQGGVSVKDVNPKTMESKKVKGLYFIGEVLDLDAVTGGFNLQIAWSTAKAAAQE